MLALAYVPAVTPELSIPKLTVDVVPTVAITDEIPSVPAILTISASTIALEVPVYLKKLQM